MPTADLSDDFVANLLKQDAKNASRLSAMGYGSYLPKRPTERAPKANTRFLRNIIRETDNHNAALLAKEKAEARARLRSLHDERNPDTSHRRRIADEPDGRHRKRRRVDDNSRSRSRSAERKRRNFHSDGKNVRRDQTRRSEKRRRDDEGVDERTGPRSPRSERPHHRRRSGSRSESSSDEHHKSKRHRKRRERSRDRSTEGSHDHRYRSGERSHHRRHREPQWRKGSTSPSPTHTPRRSPSHPKRKEDHPTRHRRKPTASPDSDPLEEILGPLPPPKVTVRGRGTTSSSRGIDRRFAADYDPSDDVAPDPPDEGEKDDWGMAVEAFRDRKKWIAKGAERLREAGFSEREVGLWEKGGEKTEGDVRWASRGEGREWDRGKVVDGEGEVGLRAGWA